MAKKILLGVLLVTIMGILVYGALLRGSEINGETIGSDRTSPGRGRKLSGESNPVSTEVRDWATLSGQVSLVDAAGLTVTTSDGKNLVVTGRPWLFIKDQMVVKIGDELSLFGFYEGDTFEIGRINVKNIGQVVAIRDENGYPLWSGKGRSW